MQNVKHQFAISMAITAGTLNQIYTTLLKFLLSEAQTQTQTGFDLDAKPMYVMQTIHGRTNSSTQAC